MGDIESAIKSRPLDTETISEIGRIKRVAKRGAVWVTMTSAAALPLAYYRNWVLGRFGSDGEVVGQFALILLFIQIVTTFGLFGGTTVFTNYLPKIKQDKDKSSFIFTYTCLSLGFCLVFVALLHTFPSLLSILFKTSLDSSALHLFSIAAPVVVFAQMVTFALVGLTEFRLSSVLNQTQLVIVCCISTIAILLFQDFFIANAPFLLMVTICAANGFVILVGSYHLAKRLSNFSFNLFLPPGFWWFSSFVHCNTFATFAYQSIDQMLVLAALGVKELGAYFIFLQCAQIIRFVPDRIGQVFLSSFSQLVATEDQDELRRAYINICRIILIFSAPLTFFIILFSHPVAQLFGDWYIKRHIYLILLATAVSIGSLGAVNSMLILAKERAGLFLVNNIIQISIQLIVSLLFINKFGVFAVIAGKATGIVTAQIGNFSIIRWRLDGINLSPPFEYYIAVFSVIAVATATVTTNKISLPWAFLAFVILCGIYFPLIRFRFEEVINIAGCNVRKHDK